MVQDIPGGWRRHPLATALLGLTVGLLLAYGIGLWQRHAALSERDAVHQQALAAKDIERLALSAQHEACGEALAAADARIVLLQVRLDLHRAMLDLDQRNFGLAQERLQAAGEQLASFDASALGLDPAAVATVREKLVTTPVRVAGDPAAQRLALLELAARLEALAR